MKLRTLLLGSGAATLVSAAVAVVGLPAQNDASAAPLSERGFDAEIARHGQTMLEDGRKIFRYKTFGSEAFWGDALQLHKAIAGEKNGGVGPGVSPNMALKLGLKVDRVVAEEGQPAVLGGQVIPSVSAWAFGGAKAGETSELYDSDAGYVVARLDSLKEGAEDDFDALKEDVRARVTMMRAVAGLLPRAEQLARASAASTLEQAATAQKLAVEKTGPFTRASGAEGLGRLNEAVGVAFGLPIGTVSAPVKTDDAVYVLRVDRRTETDRKAWEGTKQISRMQRANQVREQQLQLFLQELRRSAKVSDRRKQLNSMMRRAET